MRKSRPRSDDDGAGDSRPVRSDTELAPGDPLWVEWGGAWYEGAVVKVLKSGRVKIHYAGWDDSYDEVVPRKRLRLGAAPAGAAPAAPAVAAYGSPPVYDAALQGPLFGDPVEAATPLRAGQKVLVLWGGSWWAGEVLDPDEGDRVTIHYTGWASSWDETVPRSRLRLPAEGPRHVTVHLERDWALTGDLLEVTADTLLLRTADGGRQVVVNRNRIAYYEVGPR